MTDEVVIDASALEEIVFESSDTEEEILLTSDGVFLLGGDAVESVNDKTGAVVLTAADVGADPAGTAAAAAAGKANTVHGHAIGDVSGLAAALTPRAKIPAVAGRFYTNCNSVATFTAASVPALQRRTAFFEPLTDMTINQVGVFLTVAPAATARIKLAVYEFDAANPAQLDLLHEFAEIVADTTIGAKTVSGSFTFLVGRLYVIVQHSDSALTYRTFPASTAPPAVLPAIDATISASYWFINSVAYSASAAPTLDTNAMTPFAANPTLFIMRAA